MFDLFVSSLEADRVSSRPPFLITTRRVTVVPSCHYQAAVGFFILQKRRADHWTDDLRSCLFTSQVLSDTCTAFAFANISVVTSG